MSDRFFLNNELPPEIEGAVRDKFGESPDLKIALEGDMLPDGTFGSQWFVMSKAKLGIISLKDSKPAFTALYKIKDTDKLEIIPGTSNAVMEITVQGSLSRLLRISNIRQKEFSDAVSLINTYIKEEEWKPETVEDKSKSCKKCGKPLPENMTICPHCLDKKKMLKKVLSFLKPYKGMVVGLFSIMIIKTGFGVVTPYMGKLLVDDVLKPLKNFQLLPILVGLMILFYLLQNVLDIFLWRIAARMGSSAIYDVRASVFNKLQELSLSFFSKHNPGSIITRVNQDTGQLQNLLVDFIPYGISSLLMAVGILSLLLYLSWVLTLCILVPLITMVILVVKVFPKFRVFWERFFEKRSQLTSLVENVINGIRVVKAFAQEDSEKKRFDVKSDSYREALFQAEVRWATVMPVLHMIAMLGTPIVWLVGGYFVFKKKMTLGDIIAFTGYVGMLFNPVFILTRLAQLFPNTLAAAGRVFEIIDETPEIVDSENAVAIPRIKGKIEFSDVTFGYEPNKPVLHNLSTVIKPHTMIGLVGHSGAGKSTTINLICRLFEVNSGKILIDDVDIREIKYEDLRRQIGIVMQETFLLNGSIAENIAYARPEASVTDIIKAAKSANAHDFIMNKPDGYDTEVQQGGKNLSTGEKQRISIARAILTNPRILILDEATASVDLETEKEIQEAIDQLVKERTTIAIAHRLSTLRNADRLMVLEKGKMVEDGTHEELENKEDGVYAKLIKLHQDTAGVKAID